jgi:hypothetical protein
MFDVDLPSSDSAFIGQIKSKREEKAQKGFSVIGRIMNPMYGLSAALAVFTVLAGGAGLWLNNRDNEEITPLNSQTTVGISAPAERRMLSLEEAGIKSAKVVGDFVNIYFEGDSRVLFASYPIYDTSKGTFEYHFNMVKYSEDNLTDYAYCDVEKAFYVSYPLSEDSAHSYFDVFRLTKVYLCLSMCVDLCESGYSVLCTEFCTEHNGIEGSSYGQRHLIWEKQN